MFLQVFVLFCCAAILHGAVEKNNEKKISTKKAITQEVPCKERISGFRAQYIDIPEGCKKGQIRWTLTKRYLKLSFKVTETKELCFSSRAPSGLEKYTVFEKTEKKLAKIGTPRRGFDTCTIVPAGDNVFRIEPTGLYYGLYVRYTLVPEGKQ